jgi:hypothetical protein
MRSLEVSKCLQSRAASSFRKGRFEQLTRNLVGINSDVAYQSIRGVGNPIIRSFILRTAGYPNVCDLFLDHSSGRLIHVLQIQHVWNGGHDLPGLFCRNAEDKYLARPIFLPDFKIFKRHAAWNWIARGPISHASDRESAQASTPVADINTTMLSSEVLFLPNASFELH